MTTELLYTLLRFGSVLLIWGLIGSAVLFMRNDVAALAAHSKKGLSAKLQRSGRKKVTQAQTAASGGARYLAFTSGSLSNKRVPLKISPIIIGRAADCTVPIDDTYASGHHLRLYKKDDQWLIEDLQSTNGTLVNGTPLHSAIPLGVGVKVQIGQTSMELTR